MEDVSKFLVGRTDEYTNAAERPTGTVSVPSGRLQIVDPLTGGSRGCVLWVPPGQHRAWITYVHIEGHGWCPAYLSIGFTDAQPATVAFADFLVVPPISMVTGAVTGSDTGMIAVYDADAKIDPPPQKTGPGPAGGLGRSQPDTDRRYQCRHRSPAPMSWRAAPDATGRFPSWPPAPPPEISLPSTSTSTGSISIPATIFQTDRLRYDDC